MTDDLRARIECALGLNPAIRDGQTVPLADAVMEVAQAGADQAVRAVQGWMALDLHTALGRPVDHDAIHQGHGSWADWWADLCAEVRGRQAQPVTVTSHAFEGAPGPGRHCQAEAFGETCGAAWERHELREECQHRDPKRLGTRPGDLALICACGAQVFPGLRTTVDNPPASTDTVDLSGEQR